MSMPPQNGWNKPKNAQTPSRGMGDQISACRRAVPFTIGLLVISAVAIALWLCLRYERNIQSERENPLNKRGYIADTAAVKVPRPDRSNEELTAQPKEEPHKPTRRELRDIANGRGIFTPPAYTSQVTTVGREMKLFAHPLEQWLARFVTIEPGDEIIGEPEYIFNDRFRSKISAAMVDKIELDDGDSEEDRGLKMAVQEAKQELARYIREGNDPCEIMIATFKEIQNLGLYRKELRDEVKRTVKDAEATDEDCEDILEAANKMLAERGCGKIKMPSIFKRRVKNLSAKGNTK